MPIKNLINYNLSFKSIIKLLMFVLILNAEIILNKCK